MSKALDRDQKRLLVEDVSLLSRFDPEIKDGMIRNLSGLLRKLIIEDGLIQISNEYLGKGGYFVSAHVIRDPKMIEHNNYTVFAEDAHRGGIKRGYVALVKGKILVPDENPLGEGLGMIDYRENIPLRDFKATPVIGISGLIINRGEVIRFVANVMQGVHLFDKRKLSKKKKLTRKYKALKSLWDQWGVTNMNQILTILLGIAQDITASPCYRKLLDLAKKDFPDLT